MNFKSYIYHPFLFIAFQILTVLSINVNEVNINMFLLVLTIALAVTGILFYLINYIIHEKLLSALMVSLLGFLFFIYGRIIDILLVNPILGLPLHRNKYFLPFFFMVIISCIIYIYKSQYIRKNIKTISTFANQFSIILVAIAIFSTGLHYDWTKFSEKNEIKHHESNKNSKQISLLSEDKKSDAPPNIYYLIFDSYPSHRVLYEYYNWDDQLFVNELTNRGFSLNMDARSNYCFTGASITSTLSMRYIHKDRGFLNAYNQDNYIMSLYKKNLVMDRLQSEGYRIVTNIGGEKFPTDKKSSYLTDDFIQLIIHISLLRIIENELVTDKLREGILSLLEGIIQFEKPNVPTFMFLHAMVPHSPFVFQSDGSRPQYFESAFGKFEDKVKFVEQVRFTGNQILNLVDHIQSIDPSSIIFITSDHGYGGMDDEVYLNRNSLAAKSDVTLNPPNEYFDARFGILSAVYFPNDIPVPKIYSPVNNFRYLFNIIFGDQLNILPDKSYFAVIKQPFNFTDITDTFKQIDR